MAEVIHGWEATTALRVMGRLDRETGKHPCDSDPKLFFPTISAKKGPEFHARRLCRQCPAQAACLALALREGHGQASHPNEVGVWGGATREMLVALQRRTEDGVTTVKCSRKGCHEPADLILSVNADVLVCAHHGEDLPWR